MSIATYELIKGIESHPNADKLEFAVIGNYRAIVPKGEFLVGDAVVFIHPDSVLPEQPWAEPFRKYVKNRVRAINIRGQWSMGIVVKKDVLSDPLKNWIFGKEVSGVLGVTKFEPPPPKDIKAKGALPYGIFKTNENSWQSTHIQDMPYDQEVDVTLKIDGQSATYYCKRVGEEWVTGVTSRTLEIKMDCPGHLTLVEQNLGILGKLKAYCEKYNLSLALRGELYGAGIQAHLVNPHSKLPVSWRCFNVLDLDRLRYCHRGEDHYFVMACGGMDIPVVPILESNVPLTKDLIKKYDEGLESIGEPPCVFEGVVIKHAQGSFKVINKFYDSNK